MPERVLALSEQVSTIATSRVEDIRRITRVARILGMNAAIESARSHNPAFAVVADEVGSLSTKIDELTEGLQQELNGKTADLRNLGQLLVAQIRGSRLADLALNMIDIIDRNLYERSCDVRWWATDSAVVGCVDKPSPENCEWASRRLGVILDSYTVYLDLWIADAKGRVLANGRPSTYSARDLNVKGQPWFHQAMQTRDGAEFVACDVMNAPALHGATVATYAAAIRENGDAHGRAIGAMGIFFDWAKQSQAVVDSVRLTDDERGKTTCLILSGDHRVIATSARSGLYNRYPIETLGQKIGSYLDPKGNLIGFALTPGYETYKGLGWYGALVQSGGPG
ncbi:MAG: putative methyl-accepting chemotaxis protein [Bryobacterales bacterium]|nr:putative methyl-accepting chemotaxis protein [Bryobacterales bacterium]